MKSDPKSRQALELLHNRGIFFLITASETLEAREGGYPGDDGETPGNAPASTGCPGSRDRSERLEQIPGWFHGMRR